MAHTEGRFAKPERLWDCRRGTPCVCVPYENSKLPAPVLAKQGFSFK